MKKKLLRKKVLSIVTAIALAVPVMFGAGPKMEVKAASTKTAGQITEEMGLGWNLGNSLESTGLLTNSYYQGKTYAITEFEKYWGNPAVTKNLVKTVKAKGFDTIRIPVSWYEHISYDSGSYTIDAEWMARVKEVIDYAYDQGMYVIINVHHEEWINRSDFANAYDAMSKELKAVWKQIATEFASYDQHLIFEGMNEPRALGTGIEWTGNENCYKVVNKLNADFVNTVRSVSSPYQNTRLLMIPAYAASCYANIFSYLEVPEDDYVAVSIHAYSPYDFAMGNGDHSNFSDQYKTALDGIFTDIRTYFISKGIPVVIGEFSASNYNNESARVAWAQYYLTQTKKMGIPCVLWDNNCISNSSNPSEAHGYLNRSNNTWYDASKKVLDAMFSVMEDSSIVWGSEGISNSSYTHDGIDSVKSSYVIMNQSKGVYISGYCTDSYKITSSQLKSGREIAVKYSGSTGPKLALVNASWGNWKEVSAFDLDADNHIAYFSYDDIKSAWGSSTSAISYVYVIGTGLKVYKIVSLPEAKKVTGSNSGSTSSGSNSGSTSSGSNSEGTGTTSVSVTPNGNTIDVSKYAGKKIVALTFELSKKATGSGAAQLKTANGGWISSADYAFTDATSVSIDLSKYSNIGKIDLYMWWNSSNATMKNIKLVIEE